jgi:hypothetical protein
MLFSTTAFAGTITGVVTDRTTGKPSAGDTIAVINTSQSMDEIAKATSDSKGSFHVDAPDGGQILLHVTHGGAEYFKSVTGTASVDIDVYDSAKKIDGITGQAIVVRAETDATGKTLSVSENFFVQNGSTPPRTEYGGNTLDFYLPKGADISQTLASSPGGLPTNTKIVTLDAANGHYAFTFPIRPGDTRFQVNYNLAYSGKEQLTLKLSIPTGDVAVMLPKAMKFQSSAAFQSISDPSVANTQSYDVHQPAFGQPIEFMLAGTGQLPDDNGPGASQGSGDATASSGAATQTASGPRPGGGLGAPIDPEDNNDPWSKYKWWILSGLGLALVVGAGVMLKASPAAVVGVPAAPVDISAPSAAYAPGAAVAPVAAVASAGNPLLQALKDELFELETDRLAGRLTATEYAEHKAAFDVVLRRALSRVEGA